MDEMFLGKAVELSEESVENGGYPVGALVVCDGEVVGTGLSNGKVVCDATSHAEVEAIRSASKKLGRRNLNDCTMYSSMEPCVMCLMACSWAGISKVYFACKSSKVSKHFCEGNHDNELLVQQMHTSLEYIYLDRYKKEVLKIISSWEKALR